MKAATDARQAASRELDCWRAYERTRFCVDDDSRRVCFKAGSNSSRLDALLRRHDAVHWAFITAWNPASVVLSRRDTDKRQRQLRKLACSAGYAMLPGEGVGEDPEWEPEESVLILGIPRREAVELGRRFGQLAVVVGRRGRLARLVSCGPLPVVGHRRQPRPL